MEEISQCDVIFIAVPLDFVAPFVNAFSDSTPTQTIIDLGSTKHAIHELIEFKMRKNYVGAHPMSGTEHSGPKAAQKDLFKNKILNPHNITWKDIFKHNKAHLLHSLTDFEKHFTEAKEEWDKLIA